MVNLNTVSSKLTLKSKFCLRSGDDDLIKHQRVQYRIQDGQRGGAKKHEI